jgi:hypothetical protein
MVGPDRCIKDEILVTKLFWLQSGSIGGMVVQVNKTASVEKLAPSPNVGVLSDAPGPMPERVSAGYFLGAYKQMLVYLFVAVLIVIGALSILTIPYFILVSMGKIQSDASSIFGVTILSGSLGALFSALIRLYNVEDLPKALIARELEGMPSKYLLIYSLVPIVIGAIAAAVLYVVFAGKLVTNDVFPVFECRPAGDGCKTFISFISYWGPKAPEDFAKILVWGFIAGFAERLVPDTLQTLSQSVRSKTAAGETPNLDGRSQGPDSRVIE